MQSHTILQRIISVMDVELRVCEISALQWKNGASLMNELSPQDKGVRATSTQIDGCFTDRSHGQRIVVEENVIVKGITDRIIASEEIEEVVWNAMKGRKRDFALITTHAKLQIVESGVRKGFSSPMKGMAKRTFNVHISKTVNLPSRVKGLASNGKV